MYESVNVNRQTPGMADRLIVLDAGYSPLVSAVLSAKFPPAAQIRNDRPVRTGVDIIRPIG
jgi:hypothetical protein